jgi:folate-dependent phosphoribosylglycinamide formyltransferase PurN
MGITDPARLVFVILADEDGTTLLQLLQAITAGRISARVALVITANRGARVQDRAEDQGIPTLFHPFDWYIATGRTAAEYEHDLAELIAARAPDQVLLSGWNHPLSGDFVARFDCQALADYLAVS